MHNDGTTAWYSSDTLQLEDPYLMINHAYQNKLDTDPIFDWMHTYMEVEEEIGPILQAFNATAKDTRKFKFGIEVPRNPRHALELDKLRGDNG
jgi:hypothetical protein